MAREALAPPERKLWPDHNSPAGGACWTRGSRSLSHTPTTEARKDPEVGDNDQ